MSALCYAVPAHRGRGVIHLAPVSTRVVATAERITLATEALCDASVAAGVKDGWRFARTLRPGVDVADTPTCPKCLRHPDPRPFPTPGQPIPLTPDVR